jgi:hypothetical protein
LPPASGTRSLKFPSFLEPSNRHLSYFILFYLFFSPGGPWESKTANRAQSDPRVVFAGLEVNSFPCRLWLTREASEVRRWDDGFNLFLAIHSRVLKGDWLADWLAGCEGTVTLTRLGGGPESIYQMVQAHNEPDGALL